nr:hypothetical protein [uncultured Flavobacterium sp.]
MSEKLLHIVSFDNPYPPNYGGVIDVFYKIKALHQIGYSIHLHCFVKEIPSEYEELKSITSEVHFYKIQNNPLHFLSALPFSVISRSDGKLAENLSEITAPVLFEGLKTTCLVYDSRLRDRKKYLRLHNIEQNYYRGIAKSEDSFFKKIALYSESRKYKKYERIISEFDTVFTLSEFEDHYIQSKFNNSEYVPVFHGNEAVTQLSDFGDFVLYHGDLTTSDNRKSVAFLVTVFKAIPECKLVIASGSNEEFVKNLIPLNSNIEFVKLTNFAHLQQLLNQAHINICWSFQKSGTKLKLINSLFNSRHCIINENIIDDDKVSELCVKVNDRTQLVNAVKEFSKKPYTDSNRKKILESHLNDLQNAIQMDKILSAK